MKGLQGLIGRGTLPSPTIGVSKIQTSSTEMGKPGTFSLVIRTAARGGRLSSIQKCID
jgi:hypothetical protein